LEFLICDYNSKKTEAVKTASFFHLKNQKGQNFFGKKQKKNCFLQFLII